MLMPVNAESTGSPSLFSMRRWALNHSRGINHATTALSVAAGVGIDQLYISGVGNPTWTLPACVLFGLGVKFISKLLLSSQLAATELRGQVSRLQSESQIKGNSNDGIDIDYSAKARRIRQFQKVVKDGVDLYIGTKDDSLNRDAELSELKNKTIADNINRENTAQQIDALEEKIMGIIARKEISEVEKEQERTIQEKIFNNARQFLCKKNGQYMFMGHLGGGGQGIVLMLFDRNVKRLCLAKVGHSSERYGQEMATLANLAIASNGRIPQVFDTDPETITAVMEFIPGATLFKLIEIGRTFTGDSVSFPCLPPKLAIQIFVELLKILQVIHSFNTSHLDIKPENIIIRKLNPLKIAVLDFGITRTSFVEGEKTAAELVAGTATYMAPEVWHGRGKTSYPADIYAATVTLFEMLIGTTIYGDEILHWFQLAGELQTKSILNAPGLIAGNKKIFALFGPRKIELLQNLIREGLGRTTVKTNPDKPKEKTVTVKRADIPRLIELAEEILDEDTADKGDNHG